MKSEPPGMLEHPVFVGVFFTPPFHIYKNRRKARKIRYKCINDSKELKIGENV